jgi:hypothetical protein
VLEKHFSYKFKVTVHLTTILLFPPKKSSKWLLGAVMFVHKVYPSLIENK